MTGRVISNDGEVAIVILENGDRVRFERAWAAPGHESTRDKFLVDLPVGPLRPEIQVERLADKVN